MKRIAFEKKLRGFGFSLVRQNKHYIWSNGQRHVSFPRTREINDMLASRLLREAERNEQPR